MNRRFRMDLFSFFVVVFVLAALGLAITYTGEYVFWMPIVSSVFWITILVATIVLLHTLGLQSDYKEKPTRAFLISLFSGLSLLSTVSWTIWKDVHPLLSWESFPRLLSFICALLILINSFLLSTHSDHHKKSGLLIMICSLGYLAYLTPLGLFFSPFLVGSISGLLGGYWAITWIKPISFRRNKETSLKLQFAKIKSH